MQKFAPHMNRRAVDLSCNSFDRSSEPMKKREEEGYPSLKSTTRSEARRSEKTLSVPLSEIFIY
jgi:hypothetical protein